LFDLASVWNGARELLALSKQCMDFGTSQLAATFVSSDLVFLSSKVYILSDQRIGPFAVIQKVGLKSYKLNFTTDATFFLFPFKFVF
jgi:hypothetical protein